MGIDGQVLSTGSGYVVKVLWAGLAQRHKDGKFGIALRTDMYGNLILAATDEVLEQLHQSIGQLLSTRRIGPPSHPAAKAD
jgi:hypothetical protein